MATGDGSGSPTCGTPATGKRVATLAIGNDTTLNSVAFSPDVKTLVVGDAN